MHPVLTEIPGPWGQINLYSFGCCLGIGLLCAWVVFRRQALRQQTFSEPERAMSFLLMLLAASAGATLTTWILASWGSVPHSLVQRTSTVIAALGAGLVGVAWCQRNSRPWKRLGDNLAPGLALFLSWMQFGLYLDGASYGSLFASGGDHLGLILGTFPAYGEPSAAQLPLVFADQAAAGILPLGASVSLPVHPVQLYEMALALVVSLVSLHRSTLSLRAGRSSAEALMLLGVGQILLSPLHGKEPLLMAALALPWLGLGALFLFAPKGRFGLAFDSKRIEP